MSTTCKHCDKEILGMPAAFAVRFGKALCLFVVLVFVIWAVLWWLV